MSVHVSPSRFASHSNPFVECGIASQAIYEATVKRNLNHAALERLHQKIGDLSLEVQLFIVADWTRYSRKVFVIENGRQGKGPQEW